MIVIVMFAVIDRKIRALEQQLVPGIYHNPFLNGVSTETIKSFKYFPTDKVFKNISASGMYKHNDKYIICEPIFWNTVLTDKHHEHLLKLKNVWKVIPHLIYVECGKVLNIIPYTVNNIPSTNSLKWVSASKTRNYMLDDPLLDYLEEHKTIKMHNPKKRSYDEMNDNENSSSNDFLNTLFKSGNNFEMLVLDNILEYVNNDDYVQISSGPNSHDLNSYFKTLRAIQDKKSVIYQATLWNESNNTFGSADLLIRSNVASKIFPNYSNIYKTDVYEVYDMKWSTVNILNNTNNLNNDKKAKTYKAQLWVYVQALNKMASQNVRTAYVIGRKYKYAKSDLRASGLVVSHFNPFNDLARIDFKVEKENIKKTTQALKWIRRVRTDKTLCHNPPNHINLYPNMKNKDPKFAKEKSELAQENKEITLIYNVTFEQRNNAVLNGIKKYDDPKLSLATLGIEDNSKRSTVIKDILKVNHPSNQKTIIYRSLSNEGFWKTSEYKLYLDVETINNTIYNLGHDKEQFIFMIGVGLYMTKTNKWVYKNFTAKDLTSESEENILVDFTKYVIRIHSMMGVTNKLSMFHWSAFEQHVLLPHVKIGSHYELYDVCKWAKNSNLCMKGVYDYKLKSFGKVLDPNSYDNINVSNGLDAMEKAYAYYTKDRDEDIIKDLIKYNEQDCKTIHQLHKICNRIK